MARIIKNRRIVDDDWHCPAPLVGEGTEASGEERRLAWTAWAARSPALTAAGQQGLMLESDADLQALQAHLQGLAMIAVNFPSFTDGRGYSLARGLRRLGFVGELRAVGEVLLDQLFFLEQCGFNAFALRLDQDLEQALNAFHAYSAVPGARRRMAQERP